MTTNGENHERDVDELTSISAGTLGQSGGVPGLRLSADQIDHRHTPARWKPSGQMGFPVVKVGLIVVAGAAVIVLLALLVVLVQRA